MCVRNRPIFVSVCTVNENLDGPQGGVCTGSDRRLVLVVLFFLPQEGEVLLLLLLLLLLCSGFIFTLDL